MNLSKSCLLVLTVLTLTEQALAIDDISTLPQLPNLILTKLSKISDIIINVKTFPELANEAGLQANSYEVTTEDGYILTVFHVKGNGTTPVLLMHGFSDSADTYILRGNTSLTKDLAVAGYDVYLGNIRGNKYARKHVFKNPDLDEDFWDFSFNEIGIYDLPTIIDSILEKHAVHSIPIIGHSQGNQIMWVMCSEKPEYNSKVKVAIALAPICFFQNVSRSLIQVLIELAPILAVVLKIINVNELLRRNGLIRTLEQIICPIPVLGYLICVDGVVNPITGADNDQIDPDFFTNILIPQYPTSISVKNALHMAQINKKRRFAQYDYGAIRNLVKYNSTISPAYNLRKVTMKVFLLQGLNDKLSTVEDTDLLRLELPNVLRYVVVDRLKCSHIDFVWGKDATVYIHEPVIQVLRNNP